MRNTHCTPFPHLVSHDARARESRVSGFPLFARSKAPSSRRCSSFFPPPSPQEADFWIREQSCFLSGGLFCADNRSPVSVVPGDPAGSSVKFRLFGIFPVRFWSSDFSEPDPLSSHSLFFFLAKGSGRSHAPAAPIIRSW